MKRATRINLKLFLSGLFLGFFIYFGIICIRRGGIPGDNLYHLFLKSFGMGVFMGIAFMFALRPKNL